MEKKMKAKMKNEVGAWESNYTMVGQRETETVTEIKNVYTLLCLLPATGCSTPESTRT